jgi:hypothetical protein
MVRDWQTHDCQLVAHALGAGSAGQVQRRSPGGQRVNGTFQRDDAVGCLDIDKVEGRVLLTDEDTTDGEGRWPRR